MSDKTSDLTVHLEEIIEKTLSYLENLDPDSEEFARVTDQLTKLYALAPKKEPMFKPDALLGVFANLGGIVAILGYERAHVVTSKALGFVRKSLF